MPCASAGVGSDHPLVMGLVTVMGWPWVVELTVNSFGSVLSDSRM